jgi:hypothetical protein
LATKAARPITSLKVSLRLPRYRRGPDDPVCAYCGRVIHILNVQASVQYKYKWWYMHGQCAITFAELLLAGREVSLAGSSEKEELDGEVIMSSPGPVQVG